MPIFRCPLVAAGLLEHCPFLVFQAWEMLVLSKLRWSLPPVTAAEYVGALLPFFPIDRGLLPLTLHI